MNEILEEKMNKAWGITEGVSKEVRVITEDDYWVKRTREYVRGYDSMRLDECISEFGDAFKIWEYEYISVVTDVAIEELKTIKDSLRRDTQKNTYIKETIADGIEDLYAQKVGELSVQIREQVELITGCKAEWSVLGRGEDSKRIMSFYIYMDDKQSISKSEYRQFDIVFKRGISVEEYSNYIIRNIDNIKVYSNRKIYNNVIAIKDFISDKSYSKFHISPIDNIIFNGNESLFQIYKSSTYIISEEDSTIIIEDAGFARILIDLKNDSYFIEELIKGELL